VSVAVSSSGSTGSIDAAAAVASSVARLLLKHRAAWAEVAHGRGRGGCGSVEIPQKQRRRLVGDYELQRLGEMRRLVGQRRAAAFFNFLNRLLGAGDGVPSPRNSFLGAGHPLTRP